MGLLATLSAGAPPSLAGNIDGAIYGVNGIDKPFVYDLRHGYRFWGMAAPPTTTLGGLAGGALTGTFYWKIAWENQNTGNYGMFGNLLGPATLAAQKQTINRPSVTGIDPQVTHWVVWRTTNGETAEFFRVASVAVATTTYDDQILDAVIAANETLVEHSPPDPLFRYVREFKGSLFLYGSRVEQTGTVTVANGSANVQGNGTQFNASHVGQDIYFSDGTLHTIATFAAASGAAAITITPVKSGAITAVGYKISSVHPADMAVKRADDESFEAALRWSVFANDGDFPSGMDQIGQSLCLFKQNHVYGYDFGGDPDPGAGSAVVYPILTGRGLVNEWCLVHDGPAAYLLDRQGLYQFDGAGQADPIDLSIRRLFRPDNGVPAEDRINWAYTDTWRSILDPVTRSAIWFVTTGTETVPQTGIVYDIDRQRCTMHRFPQGIRAAAIDQDANGVYRAYMTDNLAAPAGPWAFGATRQLDGTASPGSSAASLATASGNTTLTDSGAAFVTAGAGLKGIPVVAYTSPPQIRIIASNTGTALTISAAWDANPPVGTRYAVGAVETRWRSNWISLDPQARQQAQVITLYFEPMAADITFYVRLWKDFGTSPILDWEASTLNKDGMVVPYTARTDGWIQLHANAGSGRIAFGVPQNAVRAFAVEIMQLEANHPVIVEGVDFEVQAHGKSEKAE